MNYKWFERNQTFSQILSFIQALKGERICISHLPIQLS